MPWGIRVIWLYGRVLCWPNRFRKPKNIKRMYKQGRWRACCLLKARSLIFGLFICVQVFFSFIVLLWSRMCRFWCECMVFAHECTVLIWFESSCIIHLTIFLFFGTATNSSAPVSIFSTSSKSCVAKNRHILKRRHIYRRFIPLLHRFISNRRAIHKRR